MIDFLINELKLNIKRKPQIEKFYEANRLVPYVNLIKTYPQIYNILSSIYTNKIKDNWDCVVELYRYNIKLSKSIYPYIYILENILKIRISNYLKEKYNDEWYKNEDLFFKLLDMDSFDKDIFQKFFNHKINRIVREELFDIYKLNNPSLSKSKIKSKVSTLKKANSIISDARDYCFKNKAPSLSDFVETKPTLNYWITILETRKLFINQKTNYFDIKGIFPNITNESEEILVQIIQKLDNIRLLRNAISHFSQVAFIEIYKNKYVWNIYEEIINLLHLLGCEDINWLIGDIDCCANSAFDHLHNELIEIHNLCHK